MAGAAAATAAAAAAAPRKGDAGGSKGNAGGRNPGAGAGSGEARKAKSVRLSVAYGEAGEHSPLALPPLMPCAAAAMCCKTCCCCPSMLLLTATRRAQAQQGQGAAPGQWQEGRAHSQGGAAAPAHWAPGLAAVQGQAGQEGNCWHPGPAHQGEARAHARVLACMRVCACMRACCFLLLAAVAKPAAMLACVHTRVQVNGKRLSPSRGVFVRFMLPLLLWWVLALALFGVSFRELENLQHPLTSLQVRATRVGGAACSCCMRSSACWCAAAPLTAHIRCAVRLGCRTACTLCIVAVAACTHVHLVQLHAAAALDGVHLPAPNPKSAVPVPAPAPVPAACRRRHPGWRQGGVHDCSHACCSGRDRLPA